MTENDTTPEGGKIKRIPTPRTDEIENRLDREWALNGGEKGAHFEKAAEQHMMNGCALERELVELNERWITKYNQTHELWNADNCRNNDRIAELEKILKEADLNAKTQFEILYRIETYLFARRESDEIASDLLDEVTALLSPSDRHGKEDAND